MDNHLILYYRIDLQLLKSQKKNFSWIKPKFCSNCNSSRIWGHGFVARYLYGFKANLWFKRYRCNDCHTVLTIRPQEYTLGFYYPISTIYKALKSFVEHGKWLKNISRQCQQYWYSCLKTMALVMDKTLDKIKNKVLQNNLTFITKRINYFEINSNLDPPYLTLAVKISKSWSNL